MPRPTRDNTENPGDFPIARSARPVLDQRVGRVAKFPDPSTGFIKGDGFGRQYAVLFHERSSIHTEGRAFPPAVKSVTVKGKEVVDGVPTGKKVTRKYDARGKAK